MALLTAAFGVVALACFFAVLSFAAALREMATLGGGIDAFSRGVVAATQWPLSAAWIAVAAMLIAMIVAMRGDRNGTAPARLLWPAGLSLTSAIAAVLLFRGLVSFVLAMMTPGRQPRGVTLANASEVLTNRLVVVAVAIAICVAVAIVQCVRTLRAAPGTSLFTAAALIVSLGVSAMLVAELHSYSSRYRDVFTKGEVSQLR